MWPPAPQCQVSTAVYSHLTSLSEVSVSRPERKYIQDGIKDAFRVDGRSLLCFRPLTIETDVLPSASGSVRVCSPDVELVVATNVQIHSLTPQDPDEGIVLGHVDCSPLGQSAEDVRGGKDASQYLTQLVNQYLLSPLVLNRERLCIQKGAFAWKVYIDVLILSGKGNLLDVVSVGIRAALLQTTLPLVTCTPTLNDTTAQETLDFTVDERPEVGQPFPAERIPIFVTCGQIVSRFVWDLSPEEYVCAHLRITVALDSHGQCHGIHKTGHATLPFSSILVALQNSCRISQKIHQFIQQHTKPPSTSFE